jgi:hypothetical protein
MQRKRGGELWRMKGIAKQPFRRPNKRRQESRREKRFSGSLFLLGEVWWRWEKILTQEHASFNKPKRRASWTGPFLCCASLLLKESESSENKPALRCCVADDFLLGSLKPHRGVGWDAAWCSCGGWGGVWGVSLGKKGLSARPLYSARLDAVHAKPTGHLFLALHCDFFSSVD